jgi:hypothetical protein
MVNLIDSASARLIAKVSANVITPN